LAKWFKKNSRGKTGFTLIETIVAFAIIAIILVVAVIGFNTIASVSNKAQAWNQADEALENLIAEGGEEGVDYTAEPKTLSVTFYDNIQGKYITENIKGEIRTYQYNDKTLQIFYKFPDQ